VCLCYSTDIGIRRKQGRATYYSRRAGSYGTTSGPSHQEMHIRIQRTLIILSIYYVFRCFVSVQMLVWIHKAGLNRFAGGVT
jgi:hypothetical protein